ncbi:MAG: SDR family oxidoreductase [Planctomycetota bacterium]|nr:SDR family oxidoreductase [Planctomycetota bacterium]
MSNRVFVTGVSRGLGRAIANCLANRGASVIGTVRDIERARPTNGVSFLPLDLGSDDSIEAIADLVDAPIDILVNNIGVAKSDRSRGREEAPPSLLTREEFKFVFDINVVGTFLVTRALLPKLRQGRQKLIVNVSSNLGSIGDNESGGRYAYRCSKAALNMLTKCLAADLRADGISCLSYHPGWVSTDMGGEGAPLSPESAAGAFCDFLERTGASSSGGFLEASGTTLNW